MAPAPDPAATGDEPPRSRRRVYVTRGLVASAAVLALAVQADQVDRTDDVPGGDGTGDQTASAPVDPGSVDDA